MPVEFTLLLVWILLLGRRYRRVDSLFGSSFEHALYGCFLFTIGLGRYFYVRAI